ncbi:MAG TPA: histidine phosphotransferase family protein [Azospirillaceae bacterium]|nr:histidine phosphotransferase family protein [Azospirillaceae bacterium]
MAVALDIRVVELLCSRLCHDLVSPVGAISNGVELIEEMGEGMEAEAMELISSSAEQASRRLRVFRLAYGAAGSQSDLSGRDVRAVLEGWFRGGRVKLDWRADDLDDPPRGLWKCLLNLALLGEETIGSGGDLRVERAGQGLRVVTSGRSAALRPESAAALAGGVDPGDLTPRTVQAYVTGRFAEHFGLTLVPEPGGEGVSFLLSPA